MSYSQKHSLNWFLHGLSIYIYLHDYYFVCDCVRFVFINSPSVCWREISLYVRVKTKRLLVHEISEEGTEAAEQKLYTVRAGTGMMKAWVVTERPWQRTYLAALFILCCFFFLLIYMYLYISNILFLIPSHQFVLKGSLTEVISWVMEPFFSCFIMKSCYIYWNVEEAVVMIDKIIC